MKIRDAEILIVPGLQNASPLHWQSRWQAKMSTARRVEQENWNHPVRSVWVAALIREIEAATRPVILVGHSVGVLTIAHAAAHWNGAKIAGAFLVGVSDWTRPELEQKYPGHGFASVPTGKLDCPAILLASRNDPTCDLATAERWAGGWGVRFADVGDVGHFDVADGFGPWPEGLLAFAQFTKSL
jgi:predicted alpha/beta hydrolase family esterase